MKRSLDLLRHGGLLLLVTLPTVPAAAQGDEEKPTSAGSETQEIDQAELERVTAEIRAEVEELRGHAFVRPVRVAVTDREGLLSYARRRLEKSTTPEELAAEETAAKLLGLVPVEMDLVATTLTLLEDQVGGFYDPDEEAFYLMSSFGGGLARIILSHELTHALDDQLYDLDGHLDALANETDALFAYHAVVEGSGTALMNAWTMQHIDSLDAGELMESAGSLGMESLEEAPPYLWKPLLAAYVKGAAFLARTENILMGQLAPFVPADVDAAFKSPPRSSEQVLHPEKYWDAEARDEPRTVTIDGASLPEGWSVLSADTLGEIGLALCTDPVAKRKAPTGELGLMLLSYSNKAAEGWGGDRYVLLGKGPARVLHGATVWDSPADAEQFHDALQKLSPHVAEAAAGLSAVAGLEGAGYTLSSGPGEAEVRFTSWIGLGEEGVAELIARLEVRVAAPSPEAGTEAPGGGR